MHIKTVISSEAGAKSYHLDVNHLTRTQPDTDTIICVHAERDGCDVYIMSPDTYVFILAPDHIPNASAYLGSGQDQRLVPLKPIYDVLDTNMTAALNDFPSFNVYHRTFCWKGQIDKLLEGCTDC